MKGRHLIPGLVAVASALCVAVVAPARAGAQCCSGVQCSGDLDCNGQVTVDEILAAIANALNGCPKAIGADQACTDVAAAVCTKLDQCVVNGTANRYGSAAVCRARQKQICMVRLGATSTGNTPADVEQCAMEVPSGSCNDFDTGSLPECQAKVGTLADGQPCAFSGQCQSSNCAIVNGTNCGTCSPANQAGDSCATTSCSAGFLCVQTTQPPLCQPRGAAGGNCDANHPCSAGLGCVTPAGAASGSCQTTGNMAGVTCDPKRQTDPGCDPNAGLYCDSATKTCLPATYVTAGTACGFVNPYVYTCTDASTCFGNQGATPGTCFANAANGMPCDTKAGPGCLPPAQCVTGSPTVTSGVCRFPDPTMCS